jgi:hypothetical protein
VKIRVGEPISVADYADLPAKEGVPALTAALQKALGDVVNQTSSAESLRDAILLNGAVEMAVAGGKKDVMNALQEI